MSAIPQQLGRRCWWAYLLRTKLSPSMVVFCNSWSSVSLQILSVSFWQWWPMSGTKPSAAPCCEVCFLLIAGVYMVRMADALIHTTLTFCLRFCGSNKINHLFCDVPPLLLLSCSDTQVNELVILTVFGFIELSTIAGVLVFYCYIILSVLKIHSAEGRLKVFSTFTFHLTTVVIFQGTLLFIYFRPSSFYSLDQDKMTSLFYTIVIPMLNPLIYSLRNEDVKQVLEILKNKWF